jgi:glycyl-tRNA synthetase
LILQGVKELAGSVNGEAVMPEELLREVANLVEYPQPLLAGFGREFLTLPKEVLISVMMKQQRTFPVVKGEKLLPHFIVVRNGDEQGLDLVRQGNEHVVRARFSDADFFIREDLKHKPEHFRQRLATLTFQKALGSMLTKNERIERLTGVLNGMLNLSQEEAGNALKAAQLLKFDLATRMVTEMTSLQGIIGGLYAQKFGENQSSSDAIREQYLPVPPSLPGVAVALADRLDSLVGLFAAGMAPTGTKDPFALRRAAIGVVQTLIEHDLDFDLQKALQEAAKLQPVKVETDVLPQVQEFITGRLRGVLLEAGWRYDVVEAVLSAQANNPAGASRAARALHAWVGKKDWGSILPAYARCARILRAAEVPDDQTLQVDGSLLTDPAERSLYERLQEVVKKKPGSVDEFLGMVKHLVPAINVFFDQVLVMAEEVKVRQNRLALVGAVARLAEGIADLSRLEGF